MTTIRLELGIDAQKFIQQVQIYNGSVQEQVEKGIELALNDLCEDDNLTEKIRETTKIELENLVHKVVLSWETKQKIEKIIYNKISEKIEQYADDIASKVTSSLNTI